MLPGAVAALFLAMSAPVAGASGTLAPCPASPNCVNSLDPDPERRVEPFVFAGTPAQAREDLAVVVRAMARARLVADGPGHLRAQFTSALFGFVDDVEFVIDAQARVVHVRSASRAGYYDFGVNRRRVERLRQEFARRQRAGG